MVRPTALLLLLGLLAAAPGQEPAGPPSVLARERVLAEDPRTPAGVSRLLRVLRDPAPGAAWWVRQAAVEQLARAEGPAAEAALRKAAESEAEEVRAGALRAVGRRGREDERLLLERALRDASPHVRRAAVAALASYPDAPEAVEAVLRAWETGGPPGGRLGVSCHQALLRMTRERLPLDPAGWRRWWDPVRVFWPQGRRAPQPDDPRRTRVRGVPLDVSEAGTGTPLLVLPEFCFEPAFYRPWLAGLEDVARVLYVRLPELKEFDPLRLVEFAPGLPYYPVELLVEALDGWRSEHGLERVSLLAHGYTCLVALRYLARYPERVERAVLIAPVSGNRAWQKAVTDLLDAARQRRDAELAWTAGNLLVRADGSREHEARDPEEWGAIQRQLFSLYFADPGDPSLTDLFAEGFRERPRWDTVTPRFEVGDQPLCEVPVLVQVGARARLDASGGGEPFRARFPALQLRRYDASALCPFVDEADRWLADVRAFLADEGRGRRPRPRKR